MKEKVLIAHASKYGATAGIAEKIGEVLRQSGLEVEVRPVGDVPSLDDYGAVILGSAVYYGRWRKEAVKFLHNQEGVLQGKKVWFFSSGPGGEGDPVELLEGWTFPPLQQEIADRIQPRGTAVFHGVLDPQRMNRFESWVLNKMGAAQGDFRDWELITAWAGSIAAELS
jgi:menaquinone-dependent protoporphyrinogen oxidase